jgi:hypothetical protein
MYFHWKLFLKALYLSLFRTRFRLRRWAFIFFFTSLFAAVWILVAIGRALDHLFFPRFRRQQVVQPVFIIAPPRTGTTLTQNLMSLDTERFVHVKLFQTILPCITYQRILEVLQALDKKTGSCLAKLVAWSEKRFFGGWDHMHKMRFDQPEEDDGFFVYSFVSEAIFLLFPHIDALWVAGFADDLPAKERRKLMRYYRTCLQRHIYANGPTKTLLSKATQFSGSVESILEEFPDARFITLIRHPYQSVASHVSVFYPVWRAHSPDIAKDSPSSLAYARLAVRWFQHLFRFRSRVEPQNYYCIDFRDLTKNPRAELERVYAHFGWSLDDALRSKFEAAAMRQREFSSAHNYTLEEFGLSKEWIQAELGPLLDHYALTR